MTTTTVSKSLEVLGRGPLEAIILCGGKGLRLKPHIWDDKPLLPLGLYSLVDSQIEWLERHGYSKIVLASHKKLSTRESPMVMHSIEDRPLGSGGAVRKALQYISASSVLVMNVDDLLLDLNPARFLLDHSHIPTIAVARPKLDFGAVEINSGGFITSFSRKAKVKQWVHCGFSTITREIIQKYFPDEGPYEETVLPLLAEKECLRAYLYSGRWFTINTVKDYFNLLRELNIQYSEEELLKRIRESTSYP